MDDNTHKQFQKAFNIMFVMLVIILVLLIGIASKLGTLW